MNARSTNLPVPPPVQIYIRKHAVFIVETNSLNNIIVPGYVPNHVNVSFLRRIIIFWFSLHYLLSYYMTMLVHEDVDEIIYL